MDHVSDSFLETNVPLLVLIEAAKAGDEKGVEEYAQVFAEHANKLVEVMIHLFYVKIANTSKLFVFLLFDCLIKGLYIVLKLFTCL